MPEFNFGRSLRLLDSSDFTRVFSHAELKVACPAMLILAVHNDKPHPRLGMVVPKKQVKLAARRNTIKRVIRESFRHRRHTLPPFDIVVIARRDIGNLSKPALAALLDKQWSRLERKAMNSPENRS